MTEAAGRSRNTAFRAVFEDRAAQGLVLERGTAKRPDGSPYEHYRLRIGELGGVVVVAGGPDGIIFGRFPRPAVGGELLELPRGLVDPVDQEDGRDPWVSAGLRELAEETGHIAEVGVVIGTYVVDSAIYPLTVRVVACAVEGTPTRATDGEVRSVVAVKSEELGDLMRDGLLVDAHSLAAIAVWRSWQERGDES